MALSCIISEIKLDIGHKQRFFIPSLLYNTLGKVDVTVFTLFLSLFLSQISGLSDGVNGFWKEFSVCAQYTRTLPTDSHQTQTDRQTDGKVVSIAEHLLRNTRCFWPISRFMSETIQDNAIIPMEDECELVCNLLNGDISNNLERPYLDFKVSLLLYICLFLWFME